MVTSGASRWAAGRGDAALQATPSPWDRGMVLLAVIADSDLGGMRYMCVQSGAIGGLLILITGSW